MKHFILFLVVFLMSQPFALALENSNGAMVGQADAETEKPTKIALKIDGKTVAEYRFENVPFKPYVETLRTSAGRNVLRDAPSDHLHHHGLMFAISADGCDFWGEFNERHGTQATLEVRPENDTESTSLETEIDWNAPGPKKLLRETRKVRVHQEKNVTLLDWETTLKSDRKVDLSGSHYFGLGLRFDASMDKAGRFFNDTGKHDGEIVRGDERLKTCKWTAYTAELDGKAVTVALFDHPSNPIPMKAYTMGDSGKSFAYMGASLNLHRVPVVLEADKPMTFRYRIAVWEGETSPEVVEETYGKYETIKK